MAGIIAPGAIEAAVMAYLREEFGVAGETATVGADVADKGTRFVTVKRVGGTATTTRDSAQIECGCFDATEDGARALADLVRERLWALKPLRGSWAVGKTISGLTISRITEVAGPAHSPHSTSHPCRYRMTQQLDYRMS